MFINKDTIIHRDDIPIMDRAYILELLKIHEYLLKTGKNVFRIKGALIEINEHEQLVSILRDLENNTCDAMKYIEREIEHVLITHSNH